jgi:hypothetical protein
LRPPSPLAHLLASGRQPWEYRPCSQPGCSTIRRAARAAGSSSNRPFIRAILRTPTGSRPAASRPTGRPASRP